MQTELTRANDQLKQRQGMNGTAEMSELLQRLMADHNSYDERIPESEQQQRSKRVVPRASLSDLQVGNKILRGAVDMVHAWKERKQAGNEDASMVLVGPYGTGKTHIARAVLWSIAYTEESGEPIAPAGRFFVASDLMMALSPTQGEFGGSIVSRPSDFIGNAPIVVIDDVGAEQSIPWVGVSPDKQLAEMQARYFRVVDHCYQWRISLVITSNLSLGQLEKHLGGRNWDRLMEMAPRGFMYDLTGVKSWRAKKSGRDSTEAVTE